MPWGYPLLSASYSSLPPPSLSSYAVFSCSPLCLFPNLSSFVTSPPEVPFQFLRRLVLLRGGKRKPNQNVWWHRRAVGEGEDRRARTTIVTPPTRAVKALLSTPLISREEEGEKNRDLYLSSASNQHFSSALLFPPLQPDQSYLSSSASSSLLRLPLLSLHSRFGLFIQTSGSLRQPFVASHRKTEREPGRERVRETERERGRRGGRKM